LDPWYQEFIYCLPSSVDGTSLSAGSQNIFALTKLDLNFAQLVLNLLGLSSNAFWHNLILSNDKKTKFLSLKLDQFF